MLFMYLCEVAIVSQLCTFPLYLLHGLCEDYLTCDIAFNAVMPLSRASTRGSYSRIEGVTPRKLPRNRCTCPPTTPAKRRKEGSGKKGQTPRRLTESRGLP